MVHEFSKISTFTYEAKGIVDKKNVIFWICVCARGQSYGEKETHYRQLHWYIYVMTE